jgi:hypothetical protein
MAPYHTCKYQEIYQTWVLGLFSRGIEEYIPATFCHILMLPCAFLLLLGVPLALFLVYDSWLLIIVCTFILLLCLWLLLRYLWRQYVVTCFRIDLADITKSYLSGCGSCFWVTNHGGRWVRMVGALPVKDSPVGRKQLQFFHLSVALKHGGEEIAKTLVRTVLQFAQDKGHSEVVLQTGMLQCRALALY